MHLRFGARVKLIEIVRDMNRTLIIRSTLLPADYAELQLPLPLALAKTINKAQGQTLRIRPASVRRIHAHVRVPREPDPG